MVYKFNTENFLDPFYYFLEVFKAGIQSFKPVTTSHEFGKTLAHPMLMIQFLSEEMQSKLPVLL